MKEDITVEEGKPAHNNVYGVHCQQKLATPHTLDRSASLEKNKNEKTNSDINLSRNYCNYLLYSKR